MISCLEVLFVFESGKAIESVWYNGNIVTRVRLARRRDPLAYIKLCDSEHEKGANSFRKRTQKCHLVNVLDVSYTCQTLIFSMLIGCQKPVSQSCSKGH